MRPLAGGGTMILIGQYNSPFVRRVAVALKTYDIAFEHRPWSGFGDVDKIAQFNPLRRVPTLVLHDGRAVVDSGAILEFIDDVVGHARATLARQGAERLESLRLSAFASGVADKGVSLVYERAFREGLPMWVERCTRQINDTLDLLERERAARAGPWLFGDTLSHADVMLATMHRFMAESLPDLFKAEARPALARHAAACEALPVFAERLSALRAGDALDVLNGLLDGAEDRVVLGVSHLDPDRVSRLEERRPRRAVGQGLHGAEFGQTAVAGAALRDRPARPSVSAAIGDRA